jgi:hypothetical protein
MPPDQSRPEGNGENKKLSLRRLCELHCGGCHLQFFVKQRFWLKNGIT